MKRLMTLLPWIAGIVLALVAVTAFAGGESFQGYPIVHVTLDGNPVKFDVPAINFNGRTLLPLRTVAELTGLDITWDDSTKTAHLRTKSKSESQPQSSAAQGLAPDQVQNLRSMNAAAFAEYLQENFGTIDGLKLDFLSVREDLLGFYVGDSSALRKVGYKARLEWARRLAEVMEARFEGKPFGVSLTLRSQYGFYPSSCDSKELSLSSSGDWICRHQVLDIHRFDLGSYGLQPTSVTMGD